MERVKRGRRMTEEIIIDGVNVAGCEHHLSTGYCQLQMIFQGMVLNYLLENIWNVICAIKIVTTSNSNA